MSTLLAPCQPREDHGNLSHVRTQYPALIPLFLWCTLSVLGCDRDGRDAGEGASSGDDADSGDPLPACEVVSVVELTDADAVAPNGRTGSEILAAIPESFQTTLHWDLSTSKVEVEVEGAVGQSSAVNLTFTLPPAPKSTSRIGPQHPLPAWMLE